MSPTAYREEGNDERLTKTTTLSLLQKKNRERWHRREFSGPWGWVWWEWRTEGLENTSFFENCKEYTRKQKRYQMTWPPVGWKAVMTTRVTTNANPVLQFSRVLKYAFLSINNGYAIAMMDHLYPRSKFASTFARDSKTKQYFAFWRRCTRLLCREPSCMYANEKLTFKQPPQLRAPMSDDIIVDQILQRDLEEQLLTSVAITSI